MTAEGVEAFPTGCWSPSGQCCCPDHVIRRLIRHAPWRDGEAFLCQCSAVWLYRTVEP